MTETNDPEQAYKEAKEKYKLIDIGEMSDDDFKKLKDSGVDLEKEKEEMQKKLKEAYDNIIEILKYYLDIDEKYYNIIALWIIGTYFHKEFPSYPFLYLNAMKGSGKTRSLGLIAKLSKDGEVLKSITEAVLFRTIGTIAIDEFEGITRKGNENLRELLNSSYKKGSVVKRMKQKKTQEGTEMVVERFNSYRPIVLANISGMENVLGDRCITLILEKSKNKQITNIMEIFDDEKIIKDTKKMLIWCSKCCLCSLCSFWKVYREWNFFIKNNNTKYINNTNYTNYTNYTQLFKTIKSMDLNGRELELSFPLCLIAGLISPKTLKETTLTLKTTFHDKKEEELIENPDISLFDFVSQIPEQEDFHIVKDLTNRFKEFIGTDEDWLNSKWMGRALKRLNLIIKHRRMSRGSSVLLDIKKAQNMIKMFKEVEPEDNDKKKETD